MIKENSLVKMIHPVLSYQVVAVKLNKYRFLTDDNVIATLDVNSKSYKIYDTDGTLYKCHVVSRHSVKYPSEFNKAPIHITILEVNEEDLRRDKVA